MRGFDDTVPPNDERGGEVLEKIEVVHRVYPNPAP